MNEELKIIISAEIDKLKKELKDGQKQVDNFAKKGESGGKKFGNAMKAAGKAVGTAMKAVGAAIAAGVASIVALSESTKEYRTEQAKLTTAFETAGASAETATQTYNDLYRVLGDSGQATEAAQHLAQLTTEEQALAEWTDICQGVYATFGDSLPIEGLTEAVNHSAKLGEVQGSLADALEWSGVSVEDFNAQLLMCNDESEREALIRETLNGTYKEAAEGYEQNAASILAANEAQARLTAGLAALGEAVEPITTFFKNELAATLEALAPSFELLGQGLQDIVNGVDGGAEKMSEAISAMISTILTKITEMLPMLLTVGSNIIVALLQGITANLPAIVNTLAELIPQIIKTLGELIPQLTAAILQALPVIIETLLQAVAQILVTLGEIIPVIVKQIIEIVPQLIQSILDNIPVLLEAAITFLMAIVEAIPEIIPPLIRAIPDIIKAILKCLMDNFPKLVDGAIAVLMGIVDAIPYIIPAIVEAIPEIIVAIIQALIQSIPMLLQAAFKLFMSIPQALFNIVPELLKGAGDLVKNLISKLKGLFKFDWEWPKLKMPKFSITPQGWKIGDLLKGSIPKLSITWNAQGGVFDKPTLFDYGGSLQGLGENGAEAVVPLENNLEWLDKLATMLSNRMPNTPIVLQVDGKTFAKTAVSTINDLTRQQGKLGLNLI